MKYIKTFESYSNKIIKEGSFGRKVKRGIRKIVGQDPIVNKSLAEFVSALTSLKLKEGPLDWDLANAGIANLEDLNKLIVDIESDEEVKDYLVANGLVETFKKIHSNVSQNPGGRNRADGLYLGNTHGLWTKRIGDWVNSQDEEAKQIIADQLIGWINGNIDDMVSILTPKANESHKKTNDGYFYPNSKSDLKDLQDRYDQLHRDMEEEAEPEGGEISNRYGAELEEIEKKMNDIKSKSGKKSDKGIKIDRLHSEIGKYLKPSLISRIIDFMDDGREEEFIKIRLEFFGVKDIDKTYELLVQLNDLYD